MVIDNENKKGFSLIEVLLALFILSVGSAAVALLMTSSIKNSILSKNQIIASALCQEGLELVSNMRFNNAGFRSDGLEKPSDTEYQVDIFTSYPLFNSDINLNKRLYLSPLGVYSHDDLGTPTKFYRKIQIDNIPPKVTVKSYVTWNEAGFGGLTILPDMCNIANKCVFVESSFFD